MYLRLKNFRQYKVQDWTLPDTGMVLLKGLSGAGKSSFMDALYFALYGDTSGGIKPWSGGQPEVTLRLQLPEPIEIVRTNTPNTLVVVTGVGEFRDDAGQEEIHRVIRQNQSEFSAASYIRQEMEGSLLQIGPAEQQRMIQDLAFGAEDPEVVKDKISGILDGHAKSLTKASAARAATEEILAAKVAAKPEEPPAPAYPDLPEAIEVYPGLLTEKMIFAKNLATTIATLNKELADPRYDRIASGDAVLAQLKAQLDQAEAEVGSADERQAMLIEVEPMAKPDFNNKRKHLSLISDIQTLIADAKSKIGPIDGPLVAALQKHHAAVKAEADAKEPVLNQVLLDLLAAAQAKESQACPSCGVPLYSESGVIHLHTEAHKPVDTANLKQQEASLKMEIGSLTKKLRQIEGFISIAEKFKTSMFADPMPEVKTLEALAALEAEATVAAQKHQAYLFQKDSLKKALDTAWAKKESCRLNYEKYAHELDIWTASIRPKDVVIASLSEHTAFLETINQDIESLRVICGGISEYRELFQKYQQVMKEVHNKWTEIEELKAKLAHLVETEVSAQALVGAWTRLKQLSDFAAVQSVEEILANINGAAESHVHRMFPDTGTEVAILNATKTKKGDDRAKFGLSIHHKGYPVPKMTPLSGGERKRIILAFQLALFDLYASPLLLCDEAFPGCDVEVSLPAGLESLRIVSEGKLVIVIEHGAPEEFFDIVVEF